VRIAKPSLDPANLVSVLRIVIRAYLDALDAKVTMFGWNRAAWNYTRKDLDEKIEALSGDVQPPAS
jgi:hypothetical protein